MNRGESWRVITAAVVGQWKVLRTTMRFVIQGLLDLYEASLNVDWLRFALELQETQDRLFYDPEYGGYFSGTGDDPSILLRLKEDNDGAEPAASSIAALNLLRLAQIRGDQTFRKRAERNHRSV